jgi:hypothetical protein
LDLWTSTRIYNIQKEISAMKKIMFSIIAAAAILVVGCGHGIVPSNKTNTNTTTTPLPPTQLTATAGNAQVVLAFYGVPGATSYNIYYSTTSPVTVSSSTSILGITQAPLTQTGLTNGTTYYYIVTGVNSAGESLPSNQATATPLAPIPPAPTGSTATAGIGQVALSWTASSGATSYNLYYGTTSPVTVANATKIGSIAGTSHTVTGLTGGIPYYFAVTAVNSGGESPLSTVASATPTASNGSSVSLTAGTAGSATLQIPPTTSLTFKFGASALSQNATVTLSPVTKSGLATPMGRGTRLNGLAAPMVSANDTFIAAFEISIDPPSITLFNVPVGVSGTVDPTILAGTSLNLAILQNSVWVDVATFVVGASGSLTENLPSTNLAGLLQPGTYLLYKPAAGSNTSVSNLGIVLIGDDGGGMADGHDGLQVIHLYDVSGKLLTTPTIDYLDYSNAFDLDGQAITPDGSQGIMVDGGNTVRFFSAVQTGVPIASTTTVDISNYGGDGDSVAILPNGDEAVVSGDSSSVEVLVSGILSGSPVAATTIPIPSNRDGLVISTDGTVLLGRGYNGVTVFAVAPITPVAGSIAGTVSHSFTQVANLTTVGYPPSEDGRDGMAMSPVDSTRAVVITGSTIQLLTGLTTTPVVGAAVILPSGEYAYSVSISPDGKLAIVGAMGGLLMYSGVDTGTLAQVGTSVYAPSYSVGSSTVTMGYVYTLGITLDGKYVVAGDSANKALVVIPFTSAGFAAAPAATLGAVAIPDNDQLLIH